MTRYIAIFILLLSFPLYADPDVSFSKKQTKEKFQSFHDWLKIKKNQKKQSKKAIAKQKKWRAQKKYEREQKRKAFVRLRRLKKTTHTNVITDKKHEAMLKKKAALYSKRQKRFAQKKSHLRNWIETHYSIPEDIESGLKDPTEKNP